MPKLPRLTAREICSILEKLGFSMARQKRQPYDLQECRRQARYGSISRCESSPFQILKSIMRDAGLSAEDLEKLL